MQILIFRWIWFQILLLLQPALLNRTLTPNNNLRPSLLLHTFLGVSPRANNQSNKIIARVFFLRDIKLLLKLRRAVISRGLKRRIFLNDLRYNLLSFSIQFFTSTIFPSINPNSHIIVDWFWGRGPSTFRSVIQRQTRLQFPTNLKKPTIKSLNFRIKFNTSHEIRELNHRFRLVVRPS
uniref:Uncharacterized protein n=1 Tax=Opuntia streptacantha TaxID=393608 RepID=A0A7C9EAU5_OPUST